MRRTDVTVAVATMNRPDALMRCLAAVLDGEVLPAEIVIVDQSANTETERVVCEAARNATVPLRYVRQAPRGLAASRNAAIAAASQPIIAFTDDDCVPDERWLAALATAFDTPERPGAVTGRILPLGPDCPGAWAVSTRGSVVRETFRGRALPWVVGSGGNTAVKREWVERAGGFDERLGAGSPGRAAEDMDFLYRLLGAGAAIQYEPDAVVFHERKDEAGWLATRSSYGFGMGAFCGLWLATPDSYAGRMLIRWCTDRASSLARACVKGRWRRAAGELLMLRGMLSGLGYGASCDAARQRGVSAPAAVECHQ